MKDKPLGLRERNRIRTRDEILVTMSVLLGTHSFEDITIDDICEQSGVSRGTLYSYFPGGRDQLLRDAYLRIADQVAEEGAKRREQSSTITDRIVGLASALLDVSITDEGRFYGMIGSALFGPLGGVTGRASAQFRQMLIEDITNLKDNGLISTVLHVDEIVILIAGAVREMGSVAARQPEKKKRLLEALRLTCDALFSSTD